MQMFLLTSYPNKLATGDIRFLGTTDRKKPPLTSAVLAKVSGG